MVAYELALSQARAIAVATQGGADSAPVARPSPGWARPGMPAARLGQVVSWAILKPFAGGLAVSAAICQPKQVVAGGETGSLGHVGFCWPSICSGSKQHNKLTQIGV